MRAILQTARLAPAVLGLGLLIYTIFAHDVGGREIVHKMKKERVATDYIKIDDKHGTNASFVLSFKGERTIFVYHEPRHYHLPRFALSKWIYFNQHTRRFQHIYPDLAKYIKKTGSRLAFNPGTYQLRAGIKANRSMLELTDVLSVNKEEAEMWVGNTQNIEELCNRLRKLGPKAIALTDGRKGAYSYSEEGFYYIPEFPGPRIEATGAGDSFTTAYVAALFYGKTHAEALRWGPVNAGSVVMKVGPLDGLLSATEIQTKLSRMKTYKPIAITSDKIKLKVEKLVAKKKD